MSKYLDLLPLLLFLLGCILVWVDIKVAILVMCMAIYTKLD
jgi:hypothetical protein